VTDLVAEYGAGDWSLADVALSATRKDGDKTYYAGFAITVVYSHPDLPDSRVALFDGSEWVHSTMSPDFTFLTTSAADVSIGWVSWEADRGLSGDYAFIDDDDNRLTPMRWNGTQSSTGDSGNAADATAFGSRYANTLGTDAKPFVTKSLNAGVHELTIKSNGDNYLVSTVTVTIAYGD
jgi:hypothetical protein